MILGDHVVGGYQPYILTDYVKIPAPAAVAVPGTASLVNAISSLIGGPISDFLKRRKTVTIASSLNMSVGILIFLFGTHPVAFLAYTGITGIGLGMFFSVNAALSNQKVPLTGYTGKP